MKKLNKLQINPEKVMKNKELISLRGGYGSYACFREGWGSGCMGFIMYINTAGCDMAEEICHAFGGWCVTGGDCG